MLLVANGSVFTRNAQAPFIPNGAVAIDGDTIVEVDPERELKAKYSDAEYVDAQGNLIMPGLINCHTHIYSGLARGLAIKGCNPTNFLENLEQPRRSRAASLAMYTWSPLTSWVPTFPTPRAISATALPRM